MSLMDRAVESRIDCQAFPKWQAPLRFEDWRGCMTSVAGFHNWVWDQSFFQFGGLGVGFRADCTLDRGFPPFRSEVPKDF